MKKIGASSSHLFLMELIIIILFFAFASTISLQIFAKSYRLAENTEALNGGSMAVQTAAETDKASPLNKLDYTEKHTYYNKDWKVVSESDAYYTMNSKLTLEKRQAGIMAIFHYIVYFDTKKKDVIFQLESKKYYQGETIPYDYKKRGEDN